MAGYVIDGLQMEQGDDEVEISFWQGGKIVLTGKGLHLVEADSPGSGGNPPGQQVDVGGNEHGVGKIAHMRAEPISQIVKDQIAHEIFARGAPLEVAGKLGGIE